MDNVNARRAPAVMPGFNTGSVTAKNVRIRSAPRSILASSMEISYPESLARTLKITYGTQKVTCAMISVSIPRGTDTFANTVKREIPMTISGITTGI